MLSLSNRGNIILLHIANDLLLLSLYVEKEVISYLWVTCCLIYQAFFVIMIYYLSLILLDC